MICEFEGCEKPAKRKYCSDRHRQLVKQAKRRKSDKKGRPGITGDNESIKLNQLWLSKALA